MLRQLLITLLAAGLVVAYWSLNRTETRPSLRSLGRAFEAVVPARETGGRPPLRPAPAASANAGGEAGGAGAAATSPRGAEAFAGGFDAAWADLQAFSGMDPETIPRKRMQEFVHRSLQGLEAGDIQRILDTFRATKDPGLRWVMSWLLQRLPGDAGIGALAGYYAESPRRALDALAFTRRAAAWNEIALLMRDERDPVLRTRALERIASSGWEGGTKYLERILQGGARSDRERLQAAAALGERPPHEAVLPLLEVALGPARPLGDVGDAALVHPARDLRSGAVLGVMRTGDLRSLSQLLEEADREPGGALDRMVERHLVAFALRGPDASKLIRERIARRGRLSAGEARYLGRICHREQVVDLQRLAGFATDDAARRAMEAALIEATARTSPFGN